MVAGCPVKDCLMCTYSGTSFMGCPRWCAWSKGKKWPEADFDEMYDVVNEYADICAVCSYQDQGCNGYLRVGPYGPTYPPCADADPMDYVDEDALKEVYMKIMEADKDAE